MKRICKTEQNEMMLIGKVVCMIVAAISVLLCVIEGLYAIPNGDDFHYMHMMKEYLENGNNYLISSLNVTKDYYYAHQGIFTSNIILCYISPFICWGLIGYSLACISGIIMWCLSTIFLVKRVLRYYLGVNDIIDKYFVSSIVIMLSLSIVLPNENFYWWASMTGYLLPWSLCMIGIGLLIDYIHKSAIWRYVLSCLLAFFSCGGTLQIAGITCYLYLLLCGNSYLRDKKLRAFNPFFIALLGAIVNLVAPGNWVRKAEIGGSLNLYKAIMDALRVFGGDFYKIIRSPSFWLCTAVILLCEIKSSKKINILNVALLNILGGVSCLCFR